MYSLNSKGGNFPNQTRDLPWELTMQIEESKVRNEKIPLDPSFGVVNGKPKIAKFSKTKDVLHHPNL